MSETRTPTPIRPADFDTPCVSASKLRQFGGHEVWGDWCVKHHHWLNGVPVDSVTTAMCAALKENPDGK